MDDNGQLFWTLGATVQVQHNNVKAYSIKQETCIAANNVVNDK